MSTQTYPRSAQIRDALYPYGLFMVTFLIPLIEDRIGFLLSTPLHEIGHILATFLTGGSARWSQWNEVTSYGGNWIVIYVAGVFFALGAGSLIASVLLLKKKHLWFAGWISAAAIMHGVHGHNQTDFKRLGVEQQYMFTVLTVLTAIFTVTIVTSFCYSLYKTLTGLHETR